MINVFNPLFSFDVNSLNNNAKNIVLFESEIEEIASVTQIKSSAVRQWFANVTTRRNLVKQNAINQIPAYYMGERTGDIERLYIAMLLSDGLYAERIQFDGQVYSYSDGRVATYEINFDTPSDAAIWVHDLVTIQGAEKSEILSNLWSTIVLVEIEPYKYMVIVTYVEIGSFEGSEVLKKRTRERSDYIQGLDIEEEEEEDEGDYYI